MAGAGYRTFLSGEVLTAANTQTYLMDQTITVFADATARDAAITSPTEGQYAFLKDSDSLTYYSGAAWVTFTGGGAAGSVLQVVSTTKTDTYSASIVSAGFSGIITGLTATITPSSVSSKILVMCNVSFGANTGFTASGILFRDSTAIGVGDAASNRTQANSAAGPYAVAVAPIVFSTLDAPASTSEIVYGAKLHNSEGSTQTYYVNRGNADTDSARFARFSSTITVMEVAG